MPFPDAGLRSPFRLRLGIDIPTFRGVNYENDPGAIGDEEFQDLINVRILANGKIVNRGGSSKAHTAALEGCLVGLVDDEVDTASIVMIPTGRGDPFTTPDPVYYFDPDAETVTAVTNPDNGQIHGAAVLNGRLYLVISTTGDAPSMSLWRATRAALVAGSGFSPTETEFEEGASIRGTNPFLAYGRIWAGASEQSGFLQRLVSYDHDNFLAFATEDLLTAYFSSAGVSVGGIDHAGRIYFAGAGQTASAPGMLRYRNDAGTWVSVAFPTEAEDPVLFNGVVWRGATYLFGHYVDATSGLEVGAIFKWDGTSVTVAHALTPVVGGANTHIGRGRAFYGMLVYLLGETSHCRIGRTVDGVTWNDNAKDLMSVDATINSTGFGELQIARGNLYAIVNRSGGDARIFKSPESNVTGTWTSVVSVAGGLHTTRPPMTDDMSIT